MYVEMNGHARQMNALCIAVIALHAMWQSQAIRTSYRIFMKLPIY